MLSRALEGPATSGSRCWIKPVTSPLLVERMGSVACGFGDISQACPLQGLESRSHGFFSLTNGVTPAACRLLMSVYDPTTKALLGTTLSGPIRALANNDVPKGAAAIEMRVPLPGEYSPSDPPAAASRAVLGADQTLVEASAVCYPLSL